MGAIELDTGALAERLAPAGVQGVRWLSGGASSLTYAGSRAGGAVVVKVAPPGVAPVLNRDVLRQARVLRALRPTVVPVPEVVWEDPGDPPDVPPLFVMSFVEGESLEPLFDRGATEDGGLVADRARNAARVLASLHALHPDALGLSGEPTAPLGEEIDRWCRLLETVDQELAPGWRDVASLLRSTLPEPVGESIVHGDFRLGNMLAVGARIAAVVDWEIWSVGDPRIDLGWFLLNADPDAYRRGTRYADAMPGIGELSGVYAASLGRELPRIDWFRALASFKSTATWSLIIKHNRRRSEPDAEVEEVTEALPRLLDIARELLAAT